MADFDVDRSEATTATELLRELLQTALPDSDFTEGGPASDLLVDGNAIVVAFLRKQIDALKARQSLRTLKNLPASESVSDATDAILDNLFCARDQGQFSKGVVTLHFSQRADARVLRSTRFFKTASQVFYVDSDSDVLLSADDLRANVDATGRVKDWTVQLYLTAANVGGDYNIDPGTFVSVDRFSPYLLYVENLTKFSDGRGVQTTPEFIESARSAISLRSLVNARSNNALLRSLFSTISQVLTIGHGDPEMARDLVSGVSNAAQLHAGGCMDIFVRTSAQEVVERLEIAALYARNDGVCSIFRDSNPASGSFILAGVRVGDVLVLDDGLPEAPFEYVITGVRATELDIAGRVPFSSATDELTSPPALSYSIGDNYPTFDNKIVESASPTAFTSRRFSTFNGVALPARPTYAIKRVELLDAPSSLDAYRDPATGSVRFTNRTNTPALGPPASGEGLPYFVQVLNPTEAQSARAVVVVIVGWPGIDLTGLEVEIAYDTLSSFTPVDAYVEDRFNRPGASNTLVRAQHPVYITATIPYRLRSTPIDDLTNTLPTFDPAKAEAAMVTFVNAYKSQELLDQSLLSTQARSQSLSIAATFPFSVFYDLCLPDGRVLNYQTEDLVTLMPDGTSSTAKLLNPTTVGLPATGYYEQLKKLLTDQGVTNRVTRYLAEDGAFAFEPRL